MAVACVGLAFKPKMVWRQASFPTKHRAEHTCEPYGHNNCEIYTRNCQGFEKNKSLGLRGSRRYLSFCRLSSHCQEQGYYCAVSRQLQPLGPGCLEHPTGRLQPSPQLQPSCGCQLLPLLLWKVVGGSKTWKEKDHCQVKLLEGDVI